MLSWYAGCPEEVWKQNPGAMLVMLRKLFSFGRVPEMHRMRSLLLAALEEHPALEPAERDNYLGEAELYMSFLAFNDISAMSAYHRRACALMTRSAAGVSGGNWTFGAPSVLAIYHRTPGGLDWENAEMRECMPYFYEVTEGHGSVIGGTLTAGEAIRANTIGAQSGRRTELTLGVLPYTESERKKIADQVHEVEHEIETLEWDYKHLEGKDPAKAAEKRGRLPILQLKASRLAKKYEDLKERTADITKCRFECGTVYPMTSLQLGPMKWSTDQIRRQCKIIYDKESGALRELS